MSFLTQFFGGAAGAAGAAGQQQGQQGQPGQQGQQQAAQPGQQQPGQVQQPAGVQAPAGSAAPAASPLDAFAGLWQTAQQEQKADPLTAEVIPMGAEQLQALQQRVSNVNFLSGVKPESVAAALGGDQAAFMSVINSAVQAAMLQSVRVNNTMLNAAVNQRTQEIMKALPSNVQQALTANQLRQDLPIFNHPAAAPLLSALEQNLTLNQPGITPAQATQVAKSYLQNFFAEFSGTNPNQQQQTTTTPAGIDWSKMFTSS